MKCNLKYLVLSAYVLCSCVDNNDKKRFELIEGDISGIHFNNQLTFDNEFNIYTYRNFYNGGGVGIGDFNNDGLSDIYFTSNLGKNRLYKNNGDLKFTDATEMSGASGTRAWSTGVSVVDINADGFLDIYVCNSGDIKGDNKENELFINNGDFTFEDQAKQYGLNDQGYSNHSAFIDYDHDGDLDMYLLNNSYQAIGSFNLKKNVRGVRDEEGGDKLFRNDDGIFVDVSEEAGILGSIIGFGLGVTVGDVNKDGWVDIFVSNDFFERDYLYMNNRDGTFDEVLTEWMLSISGASMGADMADINNDGWNDIFVTEMLPNDPVRLKTKTTFENWDKYRYNVSNGYYHQFTRNMLHQGYRGQAFQELGRMKGVHATDWSWGALIADLNNDSYKDIYVANGIYQDLTDQDYINFIGNDSIINQIITSDGVNYEALVQAIPSEPISNIMFRNLGPEGHYNFQEVHEDWGLGIKSFSNGSAYGDLDNDGDLDLVVNNVNMPAFLFRNNSEKFENTNYLQLKFKNSNKNTFGIGAIVEAYIGTKKIYQEFYPTRGFQSSMEYKMHIGIGRHQLVDSLIIKDGYGQKYILKDVESNELINIDYQNLKGTTIGEVVEEELNFQEEQNLITYRHNENQFVDFDRNRLLYHMRSNEGPCACKGDINGDGLEDIYLGGAKEQPGILYKQQSNGKFERYQLLEEDAISEDVDCVFFDADNDGHLDLLVASGGFEFPETSSALADRLYVYDESSSLFIRSSQTIPIKFESTSSIDVGDFDSDGDDDILVGVAFKPFAYGIPVSSHLLVNDGTGRFTDRTNELAPELINAGLINDIKWVDLDDDSDLEIVAVGDWMSPLVLNYEDGVFKNLTEILGLSQYKGWWKSMEFIDINGDETLDMVLGNMGLNTGFETSSNSPLRLYINDFDKNGTIDHVYAHKVKDEYEPMALKHDLIAQIPELKKKYLSYKDYAGASMAEVFDNNKLENSLVLEVSTFQHIFCINNGLGEPWRVAPLDNSSQVAPIYTILAHDFDKDSADELITGGNLRSVRPQVGKYDASYGNVYSIDTNSSQVNEIKNSGLFLKGDIRKLLPIESASKVVLVAARNNDSLQIFSYDQ